MIIDSYGTPQAESMLRSGQQRRDGHVGGRRALITESAAAAVFLVIAIPVAVFAHWGRPLGLIPLVLTVFTYLVAARFHFPVGNAWSPPTQLVFVPMLFVLPMPLVPLIVAGCLVADLWPAGLKGEWSVTRLVTRVADALYSLGPVLVLVLTGHQRFSWGMAPVLVLALLAQIVVDGTTGAARTWFAEGIKPSEQPQMLWIYFTDICLSSAGIAIAAAASQRPGLVLLALPPIALISAYAVERRTRLEGALELSSAYRGAARLLGDVIDAVDHYTAVHTYEVVNLAVAVSQEMGLDSAGQRDVEYTALLHDVGKIRVPIDIIRKPSQLDPAEWTVIRRHTIDGEAMLQQVGGTLAGIGRLVRASHERIDGTGYPDGLTGEGIPIESRIVSVCDAFNAMTTDRPYRPARPRSEARDELRRGAGTQFDRRVVAALEAVLASAPGGSQ